jgi:hypothetical protein
MERSKLSGQLRPIFCVFSLCLWLAFGSNSTGHGFERKQPVPIAPFAVDQPAFWPAAGAGFCIIQYDTTPPSYYFDQFGAGDGIAVYMDPEDCDFENTYPFKITNVHSHLRGPEAFVWPVEIKINILSVDTLIDTLVQPPDTLTPVPGRVQYSQTFTIAEDSAYDPASPSEPLNLTMDGVICVNGAFFLEIVYTGGTEPLYPGLVMGDVSDLPDANHNWVLWKKFYYEWYDFWEPWAVPGRAIMRVTGYPYAIDCDKLCWVWMPEAGHAPSGVPDYDQYQFGSDSVALCGPAALANCLVWQNALPSIAEPDSLMRLLSVYFRTDPLASGGTVVDSIESGLDSLFADYGPSLTDTVIPTPRFSEVVDSVKKSIGIALLIGLWQKADATWYRVGGHYVSVAGASSCRDKPWIALSDPALDNAEGGGRGRFLPPHEPHPDDHSLHNTEGLISHDAYLSDTLSEGPLAGAWILRDMQDASLPWASGFEGLNFQPGQQYQAYDPAESLYAVVEYAILILKKPTWVEQEQDASPATFELLQSYPNPFNNQTMIGYRLSTPSRVSLTIYNVLGQKVRTLVSDKMQHGMVSVAWDGKDDQGKDLSSGIYFYRLQSDQFSETKRMVLLK